MFGNMAFSRKLLLSVLVLCAANGRTAWGNAITYSYGSPDFTAFVGPTGLSTSTVVSASVTYNNPLSPNLTDCGNLGSGCTTSGNVLADLPSSWVFSDGVTQWTPADSDFRVAEVDTNASGNIVGWEFTLYTNPGLMDPEIYTISCAGNLGCVEVVLSDVTRGASANIYAYGPGSQTAWTQQAATATPEPSTSFSMVAFCFLACVLFGMRRK